LGGDTSGIGRNRAAASAGDCRWIDRAAVAGGDPAGANGLTTVTRVVIRAGSSLLLAILAVLVTSSAAVARPQRAHVLTVVAVSADTVRGTGDTPPTGLSAGDSYVSHAKLRNPAGKLVGTYDVARRVDEGIRGELVLHLASDRPFRKAFETLVQEFLELASWGIKNADARDALAAIAL